MSAPWFRPPAPRPNNRYAATQSPSRSDARSSRARCRIATHIVEPERSTLHGHFSPDLPPILTVDSGDTIVCQLLDAGWHLDPGTPPDQPHRRFHPRDPERDAGHALCGPIAIRGAEPGMTLEIEIGELRPGAWGWTVAGHWDRWLNRRLGVVEGEEFVLPWSLDAGAGLGTDRFGRTLPLRPFLGVIGMPPAAPGRHSTSPPRPTGGNIDCKELVTGSRLFLPIEVPGGLLSVGDGHALQADGEVSGTAIECPMDVARLTVRLHPELHLRTPRAETPAGTLTFGFDEDLDEAMAIAIEAMLDLMGERHDLERRHALALASLVVDLRITQVVNTVNGVHAILPYGALG